jgi:hypothetical protein
MNHNLAPDLTPFAIGIWIAIAVGVLAIVGVAADLGIAFVRRHHALRVRRHEGLLPYYGNLVLHH